MLNHTRLIAFFDNIILLFVTCGGIGSMPASGTVATVVTLMVLPWLQQTAVYNAVLLVMILIGYTTIYYALPNFDDDDPRCIVIDEVVGCLITFFCVPLSLVTLMVGLLLFRLFDIYKLAGISKIQQRNGAFFILADDIVAGMYANCILQIVVRTYAWKIS